MDKFEYRIRAEEINSLIEQGEYGEAVKIADAIKQNVKQWKAVAEKFGISRSDMLRVENCFRF